MTASLTLTPGQFSDLQAIYELERRTYIVEGASPAEELEKYLTDPRYLSLTLRDGKKLVGYAFAYIPKKHPYILALTITKEYRKQGLATFLLNEVEEHYRKLGHTEINLHVRANNQKALKLYLARKYKISKVMLNYYTDQPGLKMKKSFK